MDRETTLAEVGLSSKCTGAGDGSYKGVGKAAGVSIVDDLVVWRVNEDCKTSLNDAASYGFTASCKRGRFQLLLRQQRPTVSTCCRRCLNGSGDHSP